MLPPSARSRTWRVLAPVFAFAFAACGESEPTLNVVEPKIELDPPTLDFGLLQTGARAEQVVRVKNPGAGVLTLSGVALSEGSSPDYTFTVEKNVIGAGGLGTIRVAFAPTVTGTKTASLVVTPELAKLGMPSVALTGRAVTAQLLIEPRQVSFGNVVIRTERTIQVRVTNIAAIPAPVQFARGSQVKFCGAGASDPAPFCVAPTNLPFDTDGRLTLAPGESTVLNVSFAPVTDGQRESGDFSLQACASCAPDSVLLSGTGVQQGFRCTPETIDFGAVNPRSCFTRKLTCGNGANEPITITDWEIRSGSSADFRVEPFGAVRVLSESSTITVDLRYCPGELGGDEGTLSIETDNIDPAKKIVNVSLRGNGGGPDIQVEPVACDFGQVALIAPARCVVEIGNVGFADLEVIDLSVQGANAQVFSAPRAGTTIPVGGFYPITVGFRPTAVGRAEAELVIRSRDQDEPEVRVRLTGQGVDVPECMFQVVPPRLGFGGVERGRVASRAFEVRNTGRADCIVTGIRMLSLSDAAFSLPGGNVRSLRIRPGSAESFRVQFAPTTLDTVSGRVEFSISSMSSPFNEVDLLGTGVDATLLVVPNDVEFGTIGVPCRAREREVTIYNTGSTAAVIDSIALAAPGHTAFTLSNLPAPLPRSALTIPQGGEARFKVGFQTMAVASYAAAVEISGRFNGMPFTYYVSLSGRGAMNAVQVDEFEQLGRPKVDILFVVDNSPSMSEEQEFLGTNFLSFLEFAEEQSIDYQVGVTTTDVSGTGEAGRLVPVLGDPMERIVNARVMPSPAALFAQNSRVGTAGSATEEGLQAAYLALSNPLIFGHNSGFVRPDAVLSVILVSDEDDQSPSSVDFYVSYFLSIKGARNSNAFSLSAIVGDAPNGCTGAGGMAQDGLRYIEAAQRTGGVFQSICTTDWSRALEVLSATAFGFKSRFTLQNQPVPASIRVLVDGVAVPSRAPMGTQNWEYEESTNSVSFTPFARPEPGAHVRVEYAVECL